MIKKVKIIGQDHVNWSIDKDKKHLAGFINSISGFEYTNNWITADIYLVFWYDQILKENNFLLSLFKSIFHKKIIALITNDITNNEELLAKYKNFVDLWISPNSKITQYLNNKKLKYFQLPFYASSKTFFKIKKSKIELLDYLKC